MINDIAHINLSEFPLKYPQAIGEYYSCFSIGHINTPKLLNKSFLNFSLFSPLLTIPYISKRIKTTIYILSSLLTKQVGNFIIMQEIGSLHTWN